ncbi:hypothetical protein EDB87DRAFT_1649213, partial [Lactarius vividus]
MMISHPSFCWLLLLRSARLPILANSPIWILRKENGIDGRLAPPARRIPLLADADACPPISDPRFKSNLIFFFVAASVSNYTDIHTLTQTLMANVRGVSTRRSAKAHRNRRKLAQGTKTAHVLTGRGGQVHLIVSGIESRM